MKMVKHLLASYLAFCLPHYVLAADSEAFNAIESISAVRQAGDILVKVDLKQPLSTIPPSFSVASPPKIALDFPGTTNALGKNGQVLNEGDLRGFNIVQVADRTRLVLNLVNKMNYQTRLDGKVIYVTLSSLGQAVEPKSASAAGRFVEETLVGGKHAIRDVAFRRGKDGEGRVVVDLSDSGTGIDIKQQGNTLVVDFLKTQLPDHLRRKLDVNDFATPVSFVETKSVGDGARMVISPNGLWEHNAYQSDNQFVVEVKKIVEDPNKLVQGSKVGYQGPRVSINYQNGDVRALLRLMAEELGLNAVISETVTGTTTLVLKDVPADQVIDIIFQQKGLDMRKKGNIIMIAPRDEIATRERTDFESKQQISELEPLKLEQFALNYQKAVDVARLLAGLPLATAGSAAPAPVANQPGASAIAQRILSKRGSAVADPQSNILFVNDIPSKLDEIRSFIKAIDIGARQVLIEARVVEANDTFNRDLGIRLGFLNSNRAQIGGTGLYMGGGAWGASGQTSTGLIGGVNLPTGANSAGSLNFSLFNASLTKILNLELNALETDGVGKIISSPRVITANNVKAKIEDGTEIPFVTPGTNNSPPTVTFKPAKLSLEVTPQITPEGSVRLNLIVKKEEADWEHAVNVGGFLNPPIKSTIVETNVLVDNGGTVVIGGVFKTSNNDTVNKVPLLGDIPAIGWLFKNKETTIDRKELLVFITPRVISDKMRLN